MRTLKRTFLLFAFIHAGYFYLTQQFLRRRLLTYNIFPQGPVSKYVLQISDQQKKKHVLCTEDHQRNKFQAMFIIMQANKKIDSISIELVTEYKHTLIVKSNRPNNIGHKDRDYHSPCCSNVHIVAVQSLSHIDTPQLL